MSDRTARPRRRRPPSPPCLYLGCFYFDEPGDRERTGSFQLVVEATSPEDAVDRCQRRLRGLRETTTLFDDPVTIYIEGIIKLTGSFENGLLVNWESGDRPPPPDARITCMIPEQKDHKAIEYGWRPDGERRGKKKGDLGEVVDPFLDFGGEGMRRALQKARGQESDRETPSAPTGTSRLPPIPTLPMTRAGTRSGPSAKEAARAERQARRERRTVLATTLDEMRGDADGAPVKGRPKPKRR